MPIDFIKMKIDEIKINKRTLMKSIELQLPQRGVVVISGKNGVGKTLLLRKIHELLSDISVLVDQENDEIIHNLSVVENISLSSNSEKNDKVIKILDGLNLQKLYRNCNVKTLSGGEKRFISILRALATDKKVIILDEPTNDLDNHLVDSLISTIRDFKDKLFILATHDDRFNNFTSTHYHISRNALEKIKDASSEDLLDLEQYEGSTKAMLDLGIVKKVYKPNWAYTVLNIILALLLSLNIVYSSFQDLKLLEVPENYHDIFSPMSDLGSHYLGRGALPTALMDLKIDSYKDYKSILGKIKNTEKYAITYNLDWKNFGDGVAFPVELYKPVNRESIMLINNSSYLSKTVENSMVTFKEIEEETKNNKNLYNILNTYPAEEYKQVYVHFAQMPTDKFIETAKDSGVMEGNYFYISKESARLSSMLISIRKWIANSQILLIIYLNILVFSLCYSFIFTKIKLKTFRIFTNLGVGTDTLYDVLKEQSKVRYGVFMILIIASVLAWSISRANYPVIRDIYAIMVLSYFIEYYLMEKSKYWLYRLSLRRARSWDFR